METPQDLQVAGVHIPARLSDGRLMRIRYAPPGVTIPRISLAGLLADPGLARAFTGKVVFVGVTAPTAGDRLFTPYSPSKPMAGLEIHANAFETMAQRRFLTDAPQWAVVLLRGPAGGCRRPGLRVGPAVAGVPPAPRCWWPRT